MIPARWFAERRSGCAGTSGSRASGAEELPAKCKHSASSEEAAASWGSGTENGRSGCTTDRPWEVEPHLPSSDYVASRSCGSAYQGCQVVHAFCKQIAGIRGTKICPTLTLCASREGHAAQLTHVAPGTQLAGTGSGLTSESNRPSAKAVRQDAALSSRRRRPKHESLGGRASTIRPLQGRVRSSRPCLMHRAMREPRCRNAWIGRES